MPEVALVEAVRLALARAMEEDERVLLLGEDVGINGGVFRATDGLLQRFGAGRVFDTPLSESLFAGLAVGLGAQGFSPVMEFQFMGFVYPAVNQLLGHAARLRNRTRGRVTVPMVVRMPYGGGIHSPEHHSESYESLFIHSPGIKVVVPSTPHDAKGLLVAAIRDDDPVLFMEPKRIYRAFREAVPAESYTVPLGKADIAREGTDVTLIAWGAMVRVCLDASEVLAREDISAEVVDLRTLNPLDRETMIESVVKTGRAVVVHEAVRTGGFGAEIAACLADAGLTSLLAPVRRVAGYDTIMPLPRLEAHYMPSSARVRAAAHKVLEFA